MDIRAAEGDDLSRCAQLYAEVFNAQPYRESWSYGNALRRLEELKGIPGNRGFVAEQHGLVVGFAFCSFHTWWVGRVMRIEELVVDFRIQRHGIGTMLLEHCVAAGREEQEMAVVEVLTPRTVPALEFYASHGFISAGRELLSRRV